MHPFVIKKEDVINFVGPAFRDYVIGELISDSEYSILADEYCARKTGTYVPSELLIDLYHNKGALSAKFFDLFYISAKGKEHQNNHLITNLLSDDESTNVTFELWNSDYSRSINKIELQIESDNTLHIGNISDATIRYDGEILVGNESNSVEITNCIIECKRLRIKEWTEVNIKASNDKISVFDIKEDIITNGECQFRCYAEKNEYISISARNVKDYYTLYHYLKEGQDDNETKPKKNILFWEEC